MKIARILLFVPLIIFLTGCYSTMHSLFNSNASMVCTGRTDWVVPTSKRAMSPNVYIEQIYVMHPDTPCGSAVNMDRAVEMAKVASSLVNLVFSSSSGAFHLAGSFTLHPNGYVEEDFAGFFPLHAHDNLSGERERFKQLQNYIDQIHLGPGSQVAPTTVKLDLIFWIGPLEKRTRLPE